MQIFVLTARTGQLVVFESLPLAVYANTVYNDPEVIRPSIGYYIRPETNPLDMT